MLWPTFPGSRAMKRRIAWLSAPWLEAPERATDRTSGDAPARQPLSLSTREVVESLRLQWNNEQRADPCRR
jgi:hypothetical protein